MSQMPSRGEILGCLPLMAMAWLLWVFLALLAMWFPFGTILAAVIAGVLLIEGNRYG